MRYRTRPEYVDAFRTAPSYDAGYPDWAEKAFAAALIVAAIETIQGVDPVGENVEPQQRTVGYHVHSQPGDMPQLATFGDWIVRDADGDLHVMNDEIFTTTFEAVPEEGHEGHLGMLASSAQLAEIAGEAHKAREQVERLGGGMGSMIGAAVATPSPCRMVMFTSSNEGLMGAGVSAVPAVVTRVDIDGTVDLTVFRVGLEPVAVRGVPHELDSFAGERFWFWPPRT